MKQSKAIIDARRNNILECLRKSRSMKVEELSRILRVSDITVRRDLQILEEQGQVERFFGGAQFAKSMEQVQFYEKKQEMNRSEKEIIADCAVTLVRDGSSIFMNSGTTVMEVMWRLQDRHMAIITNNAAACDILSHSNCELLCTGGLYNSVTKSYLGEFASGLIRETFAQVAIMGVNGISAKSGITTPVFQETSMFRLMLQRCREHRIVVADSSKIGKVQSYKSADITEIDILITTSAADPEEIANIRAKGVQVILADKQ